MNVVRCAVAAVVCVVITPAEADTTVKLFAEAVVDKPVYQMRDIADIRGDDVERLSSLPVGVAPRVGSTDRVSKNAVARLLERQIPALRNTIQWQGSDIVVISTEGRTVRGKALSDMALKYLRTVLEKDFERIEVAPVEAMRDVMLPKYAELQVRPFQGQLSRRMVIWMDARVDGQTYAAFPVWFSVKAWKNVPVAQKTMPAGAELKPDDFRFEIRDVLEVPKTLEEFPKGAARLRHELAAGAPLSASMIERIPAVSRHQQVAVRLKAGNIQIETSGLAQANGRVGDVIAVRPADGNETFLAEVLGPGVVKVNVR